MPYNNAVPQLNQTIASTTDPIRNNFAFLNTGIGQEHNFNAAGTGSDMYHLRASMPNQADPVALPAGTNGEYYVGGGLPKFYNTSAQFIQLSLVPQAMLTGVVAITNVAANVVAIPPNSVGQYYLFRKAGVNTVQTASAGGLFATDSNSLELFRENGFDPGVAVSSSGLTWRAAVNNVADSGNYTYLVVYFNP